MTRFLQFHTLTVYPPSNPNRDDSNRPKTVRYGFVERLRISSQSLKRAWRISTEFLNNIGTRLTKDSLSSKIDEWLQNPNDREGLNMSLSEEKIEQFKKDRESLKSKILDLVTKAPPKEKGKKGEGDEKEKKDEKNKVILTTNAEMERIKQILRSGQISQSIYSNEDLSADVAMFGRMMTHQTAHNVEAAVQVSHAFTVHAGSVEDDFFTAVDELKSKNDTGAGFLDSRAFGSGGVYYLYLCVDVDLLLRNLKGNEDLAQQAIQGLLNAMTTVAPGGMQNSFGSRVRCEYLLAEYGTQQPRSLATAFLQAVYGSKDENPLELAKRRLETTRQQIDEMYGNSWEEYRVAGSAEREIKKIAENASEEDKIKLERTNQHFEQHNKRRTDIPGITDFCITKVTNPAKQKVQSAEQVQEQEGEEKAS
jgi:CRISPR system Cascade subunit CasC